MTDSISLPEGWDSDCEDNVAWGSHMRTPCGKCGKVHPSVRAEEQKCQICGSESDARYCSDECVDDAMDWYMWHPIIKGEVILHPFRYKKEALACQGAEDAVQRKEVWKSLRSKRTKPRKDDLVKISPAFSNIALEALKLWGIDAQLGMLQEECGELVTAVNKYNRTKKEDSTNLVDEIADVFIMCAQAAIWVGEARVQKRIHEKVERLQDKIGKNK